MHRPINQLNQLYKEIQHTINYCCKHKHFNADAAFLVPSLFSKDLNRIILIYQDNSEIPTINSRVIKKGHCTFFKISTIYSMILEKDINIYNWFQNAIPIHDKTNIIPVILSALKPIYDYNMKAIDTSCSKKGNILSIKFYGISSFQKFISATVFSICSVLDEVMKRCCLIVTGDIQQNDIQNNYGVISIYFREIDLVEIKPLLLKFLYNKYTELELYRIEIPNETLFSGLFTFSDEIAEYSMELLSNISNSLIQNNISNEWSLGYSVSKLLYLYIIIGKSLFPDMNNFLECNDITMSYMLESVISEIAMHHISFEQSDTVKKKIMVEYNQLAEFNATSIFENYLEELNSWNTIITDEEEQQSINRQLKNILTVFKDSHFTNNYNHILYSYFTELYNSILSIYRIPKYFYSYIPYCIKYIYNHAI